MTSRNDTVAGSIGPPELKRTFNALPKTEMHLHIEGSIALDEYREVVNVPADWTPPGWAANYRYETFKEFEDFILGYADGWYDSPERYARSAKSLFERKLAEGVRYLECSDLGNTGLSVLGSVKGVGRLLGPLV